jgi:hypothetical protein
VTITGKLKLEPTNFDFDYSFGPEVEAADLFRKVGRPLVERALAGQIGVVFAYGQTGSGKTHTMGALMDELVAEVFQADTEGTEGGSAEVCYTLYTIQHTAYSIQHTAQSNLYTIHPPHAEEGCVFLLPGDRRTGLHRLS